MSDNSRTAEVSADSAYMSGRCARRANQPGNPWVDATDVLHKVLHKAWNDGWRDADEMMRALGVE